MTGLSGQTAAYGSLLVTAVAVAVAVPLPSRADRLLAGVVAAVAQLVGVLLVVGAGFKTLETSTLLAASWGVSATAVVALLVAAVTRSKRLPPLRQVLVPAPPWHDWTRTLWAWLLVPLAVASSLWSLFVAWVLPPYSWDGIWYHLTSVATWVQYDKITTSPIETFSNVYPQNAELTYLWAYLFAGTDSFIDAPQAVFALVGALAVAALARAAGCSRPASVAAGSLFALTPIVMVQGSTNYVDVIAAALSLAAFAFAVRAAVTLRNLEPAPGPQSSDPEGLQDPLDIPPVPPAGSSSLPVVEPGGTDIPVEADPSKRFAPSAGTVTWLAACVGVAGGLAVGTKSVSAVAVGVSVLLVAGHLVVAVRARKVARSRAVVSVVLAGLLAVVFGGFFYARNLSEYHNPLYPFEVKAGSTVLFDGPMADERSVIDTQVPEELAGKSEIVQVWESWNSEPTRYVFDQRLGGLGPQWVWLLVPALVALVVVAYARRRDLLTTLVLPSVVLLAFQPAPWWSRFSLVLVGPAAVAFALLVDMAKRRWLAVVFQVLLVALVVSTVWRAAERRDLSGYVYSPSEIVELARGPARDRSIHVRVAPWDAWAGRVDQGSTIVFQPEDVKSGFFYPLWGGGKISNRLLPLPKGIETADELVEAVCAVDAEFLRTLPDARYDVLASEAPDVFEPVQDDPQAKVFLVGCP
jgi:hypothetical protein